jgi:cytochrome oxidase Cu insertion factor (SCO1/SenC/PrrC family)
MNQRVRILAAAALVVAAVAAVAIAVASSSSPEAVTPRSSGATAGATARSVAPRFELASVDGKRVSLPAGRPGMVMFSSSTCVTCFVSVRFMAEVVRSTPRRIDAAFVSVDPGDSPKALAQRRDSIGGAPFAFAIDTSGNLAALYGITSLGAVVIFNARGEIVWHAIEPGVDDLRDGMRRAGVR